MSRRWKPEICEINKINKKQRFFDDFQLFFSVLEYGKSRKSYFFNNKWLGGSFFVRNRLKLRKRSWKLWNRRAQRLPNGRKHWKNGVRPAQGAPQCCEPGPRGREGKGINPLPRDWEGRDLFKNLSIGHLHALRHKASADNNKKNKYYYYYYYY